MIELLLIMAVLGGAMWYFWGLVSGAFADGQKSMGAEVESTGGRDMAYGALLFLIASVLLIALVAASEGKL